MGRRAALAAALLGPPRGAVVVEASTGDVVDHATIMGRAAHVREVLLDQGLVAGALVCIDADGATALLTAVLGVLLADAVPVCSADRRISAPWRVHIGVDVDDIAVTPTRDVRTSPLPVDAALAVSTSGSTGAPRVVLYGGDRLRAHIAAIAASLPRAMFTRLGIVLPLTSAYGLVGQLLTTTTTGGTAVLLHGVTGAAAQLAQMTSNGVTGLASVSTHLRGLADVALDMSLVDRPPLLAVGSAGGPLSLGVARRLKDAFPAATLFNQYGLTEAGPRVCVAVDDSPAFWRGSVGRPLPGVAVVVVDEDDHPCPAGRCGEVVVCSPWAMLGLLPTGERDAERPLSQHGLRTGDVGHLDDDGFLTLDGRLDDIANVAGVRVAMLAVAARVQQVLEAAFCHIVAVADDVTGARLVALVPTSAVGTGRLPIAVVQQFTAAERPALLVGVDVLPTLPSGKLDRAQARGIAEAAWSGRGVERV